MNILYTNIKHREISTETCLPVMKVVGMPYGQYLRTNYYIAGGYSKVFVGLAITGQHAGEFVAIKQMNLKTKQKTEEDKIIIKRRPTSEEQFLQEVAVLKMLDWPVFDSMTFHDKHYLATPLMELDLFAYVTQSSHDFSVSVGCCILSEIVNQLQKLHDQGIVHRDIKLENILIDKQGKIYLTDVGLATKLNQQGFVDKIAGTRAYMSPECLSGNYQAMNTAVDVWSLAVVVASVLTGKAPAIHTALKSLTNIYQSCQFLADYGCCVSEDSHENLQVEWNKIEQSQAPILKQFCALREIEIAQMTSMGRYSGKPWFTELLIGMFNPIAQKRFDLRRIKESLHVYASDLQPIQEQGLRQMANFSILNEDRQKTMDLLLSYKDMAKQSIGQIQPAENLFKIKVS